MVAVSAQTQSHPQFIIFATTYASASASPTLRLLNVPRTQRLEVRARSISAHLGSDWNVVQCVWPPRILHEKHDGQGRDTFGPSDSREAQFPFRSWLTFEGRCVHWARNDRAANALPKVISLEHCDRQVFGCERVWMKVTQFHAGNLFVLRISAKTCLHDRQRTSAAILWYNGCRISRKACAEDRRDMLYLLAFVAW